MGGALAARDPKGPIIGRTNIGTLSRRALLILISIWAASIRMEFAIVAALVVLAGVIDGAYDPTPPSADGTAARLVRLVRRELRSPLVRLVCVVVIYRAYLFIDARLANEHFRWLLTGLMPLEPAPTSEMELQRLPADAEVALRLYQAPS